MVRRNNKETLNNIKALKKEAIEDFDAPEDQIYDVCSFVWDDFGVECEPFSNKEWSKFGIKADEFTWTVETDSMNSMVTNFRITLNVDNGGIYFLRKCVNAEDPIRYLYDITKDWIKECIKDSYQDDDEDV